MADVVIVGPVSWNTLIQLPAFPNGKPQTLIAEASWMTLGGTSAGKALHLADLRVPVTLSTVIGTDPEADLIRAALSSNEIKLVVEQMPGPSERHTNLMAAGARLSIYVSITDVPADPLPAVTHEAIMRAEHVVLDLSSRALDAIPVARSSSATIWTDLHDYDGESSFHQPFVEAADHVFLSVDALLDPRPVMTRLLDAGKRLVVCTMGANGAIALDRDGWHQVAAAATNVVDSNGAGDAFLAGFLAATRQDGPVEAAMSAGATQATRALRTRHLSPLLEVRPERSSPPGVLG